MPKQSSLAAKIIEAGGKLTVRSALNPILWLCAIITLPTLAIVPFAGSRPTWLIALACAPVATAILGFFFLLFIDRDKLQSEDYQIKKRSLELLEQSKGDAAPRLIDPSEVIETPHRLSRFHLQYHGRIAPILNQNNRGWQIRQIVDRLFEVHKAR